MMEIKLLDQPSMMQQAIVADGFCCPYAWARELVRSGRSAESEAKRLGVGLDTVKRWRRKLFSGNLTCKNWKQCQDPPRAVRS
jgi:hypothetical protein